MALFRMKPHYRKRGGTLSKYGMADDLSSIRDHLSGISTPNKAIFGGGRSTSAVECYDASLVKSFLDPLSSPRYYLATTLINDYAVFIGGYDVNGNSTSRSIDCISLSSGTGQRYVANNYVADAVATTVGNYIIYGGGYRSDINNPTSEVHFYDSSMTHIGASNLYLVIGRMDLAAVTIGDYGLLGGGQGRVDSTYPYSNLPSYYVDVFTKDLTRINPVCLSVARYGLAATSINNYALFGGGLGWGSSGSFRSDTVDAFNKSLTRLLPPSLSFSAEFLAATFVKNFALFGGGNYNNNGLVDAYDARLTKQALPPLKKPRYILAAASVNNYALFGGGQYLGSPYGQAKIVDVYQVT